MKTSHYLKKAGAVCMAAAMMTGCASGSSGANGKTLTVGLNTGLDRKSTRLNSSHSGQSRMPSSA